jgi:beta-lactamase superfamily II metal-dependent hydrolase
MRELLIIFMLAACAGPETVGETTWPTSGDGQLHVYFVDVGQGDGIIIVTPDERVVLIDSGPPAGAADFVEELRYLGVQRINLALISHAHADHIGGLQSVIDAFEVMRYGDPGFPHTSEIYLRLLERVVQSGAETFRLHRGQTIMLDDDVQIRVLSPGSEYLFGTRSDPNSNSLVLLLEYGDVSMLFMGDAEGETEALVLRDDLVPDIDVLKVAHHGSRYATSTHFLEAARPEIAIISCSATNSYGHPTPETLARLAPFCTSALYRTDRDGTVSVTTDGDSITVQTEHRALTN